MLGTTGQRMQVPKVGNQRTEAKVKKDSPKIELWRGEEGVGIVRLSGRTDIQVRQGAAAWRCTAEPTPGPPSLSGTWKSGEVASRLMSCDQNPMTSASNVLASSSRTKLIRSTCWLAAPTCMVRRSLTVCTLRPSALSSAKGGSNVAELACGLLHGGLFTRDNKCGFDRYRAILGKPGPGKMPSTLGSWRVGAQG